MRTTPLAALAVALPLLLAGSPAAADTADVSAVLVLAQPTGARQALHALAGRGGRHDLKALAPSQARQQTVLAWLDRHGLDVTGSDGWTVTVRGTRAKVAAVRAGLPRDVTAVLGLRTDRVHAPRATADGADHPLTPAGLRAAYDMPTDWKGAGLTIGVLNLSGWQRSDLTTFAQQHGQTVAPGQVTEVNVGLSPTAIDGQGGDLEVALDSEALLATAPAAKQRLYFAQNTEEGIIAAFNKMADDAQSGLIQVATTSWGSCEPDFLTNSPDLRAAYPAALDRLVAAGATLFAAVGDTGAYDCSLLDAPDNQAQVDFPASYVNTVGVGGTTITPGYPESAWWDGGYADYLGDGTGGGESLFEPQPSYQSGLLAGTTHRLVPDVAAVADTQSGLEIYVASAGGRLAGGGTSLSSPTWAGLLASALSGASRTTGLGNILPALYAEAAAGGAGLADVTTGQNGLYTASAGYDRTTGLGVARWSSLGPALIAATPSAVTDGTPTAVAVRPAPLRDPVLSARRWVRTASVPISVTGPSTYKGYAAGETVAGCAALSTEPPSTVALDPAPYQGTHLITLTALDSSLTCHAVVEAVDYDTVSPRTTVRPSMLTTSDARVRVTLGGTDEVSGIGTWHVVVRDAAGALVIATDRTAPTFDLVLRAGTTYTFTATGTDRAGNVGNVVTGRLSLPFDDTVFARTGSWGRDSRSGDYQRSHLRSGIRGSTVRATVTGREVSTWLLRSPSGGYADLYLDGRRTQRVDLYSPSVSLLRVRLGAFSAVGRHSVQVAVIGAHRSGSRGNDVLVDALAVTS